MNAFSGDLLRHILLQCEDLECLNMLTQTNKAFRTVVQPLLLDADQMRHNAMDAAAQVTDHIVAHSVPYDNGVVPAIEVLGF